MKYDVWFGVDITDYSMGEVEFEVSEVVTPQLRVARFKRVAKGYLTQ
jgi:hypothetical protein